MAVQPTGSALFAALSEHIYRRDEQNDQAIKLSDIRDDLAPLQDLGVQSFGLGLIQDTNGYIYSTGGGTSGFCAMVTLIGGQYVITFRGVDSALSAWGAVFASDSSPPPPQNPQNLTGARSKSLTIRRVWSAVRLRRGHARTPTNSARISHRWRNGMGTITNLR
jgi:hypothetical protein